MSDLEKLRLHIDDAPNSIVRANCFKPLIVVLYIHNSGLMLCFRLPSDDEGELE